MNEIATYYIESILSTIDREGIEELVEELQDSCEEYHDWNCTECVIYQCNNTIPNIDKTKEGCDCYMNGNKMRQYIIESYS
jgi:hypothetical protein